MAAPPSKTIGDLNGKWVMNKTLSDDVGDGLALQGVGWITRKAIGLATVTLHVNQYTDADGKPHIDIEQTATGGIKGTSEHRTLDDTPREHADWLFGKVKGRSFYVAADALTDKIQSLVDDDQFLHKGWLTGEEERTGPNGTAHVVNWVEAEAGWVAAQVWGFQTIGGERRYARNIAIVNNGKKVELTLVYDYLEE